MLLVMVTSTHNDAELLNGLLDSLSRWSIKPSHIFVIDDLSDTPYSLPEGLNESFGNSAALSAQLANTEQTLNRAEGLPGIDIVRPGKYLGLAQAKSFGIGLAFDAGADVVLSIDCDVRLFKHWLKESLTIALEPGVGMVGSDLEQGLEGDVFSDYLRQFEAVPHSIVETQFLAAGVWLLREDVWRASGGLQGHEQSTHEDLYFCNRLISMDYTLVAHNELPATKVRKLNPSTYFYRQLRYLGAAILEIGKNRRVENALSLVVEQADIRLEQAKKLEKPSFIYIELLWMSALLFYLGSRGGLGTTPRVACEQVGEELTSLLATFPKTKELLQKDLVAMDLLSKDFVANLPDQTKKGAHETGDQGTDTDILVHAIFGLWRKYSDGMNFFENEESIKN